MVAGAMVNWYPRMKNDARSTWFRVLPNNSAEWFDTL